MFRNMRGVFVVCHDCKSHLVASHGLQDILPMTDHFTDEIGRLQQGVIRHIIRSHHRKSVHIHMLGVKRIERQRLPHTHRRLGHPIAPPNVTGASICRHPNSRPMPKMYPAKRIPADTPQPRRWQAFCIAPIARMFTILPCTIAVNFLSHQ